MKNREKGEKNLSQVIALENIEECQREISQILEKPKKTKNDERKTKELASRWMWEYHDAFGVGPWGI